MKCKDCVCFYDGYCAQEPPEQDGKRNAVPMNRNQIPCRYFQRRKSELVDALEQLELKLTLIGDKLTESGSLLAALNYIADCAHTTS